MIFVVITIAVAYLITLYLLIIGFDKAPDFQLTDTTPAKSFSVVIPFRNEADNLPTLLKSIRQLSYPHHLFEIILVNDESTDHSLEIINTETQSIKNIRVINNQRHSESPKKDAIATAIKMAKFDWIITTDADCSLPKYWLDSYDAFLKKRSCRMIIAPVNIERTSTFLELFQVLDFLSLQGATIGGFGLKRPFLANGANLGYDKSLFSELDGFEGNTHIASGDDMFLLEKALKKFSLEIAYLKCNQAIVATKPVSTWKSLIDQRSRWASKTKAYKSNFAKFIGLIVFLMNTLTLLLLPLLWSKHISLNTLVSVLLIKLSMDFYLIFKSAMFFNQTAYLKNYFFSFCLYPFLSVFIVLKTFSGFYVWKGRKFKS